MERFPLDANAGLPAREEVLETWLRVEREVGANPSALHRSGRRARAVVQEARDRLAAALGVDVHGLVLTSGATEANDLALLGFARAARRLDGVRVGVVGSAAEHPSVTGPLRALQQAGHALAMLPLDRHARVVPEALRDALAAPGPPRLVALQWANQETGAVQPVAAALDALRPEDHLHVDAVQGLGKLPWPEWAGRVGSFTLSGHKVGAPKGIGLLWRRPETPLDPLLVGGGQQEGLRPGTESPALALALAHAVELALAETDERARRAAAWRERFLGALRASPFGERIVVHTPLEPDAALPNTLSLGLLELDGRILLPALDAAGLDVSAGSACASGSAQPSPVLLGAGVEPGLARASVRISVPPRLEPETSDEAAARFLGAVSRIYEVGFR